LRGGFGGADGIVKICIISAAMGNGGGGGGGGLSIGGSALSFSFNPSL
tara:strand:- start:2655 stop:2798 length:144 start_codon:yes stop_codon:yes gene_type:complete